MAKIKSIPFSIQIILSLFILSCLFQSCNNKDERKEKNPTLTFDIDFPHGNDNVQKSERTNIEFPESKVINWTQEGFSDSGVYYMYFVAQDVLSTQMKEDVKLFEEGYYELLETVLGGGLKNFEATNPAYQKLHVQGLYGLEVVADYAAINNDQQGCVILHAYTDGHNVIIAGVANQNREDLSNRLFINSFKAQSTP